MHIARTLLPALLLPFLWQPSAAAPLDAEACATLRKEYEALVAAGAKADMSRGADWAKTNLPSKRLERIERLINAEEQLSFRCGEQLTARPQISEPPPAKAVTSGFPLPKRKDARAASAARNRQAR